MNKTLTLTIALCAAFLLTACPGGSEDAADDEDPAADLAPLQSAPAGQINADNALEEVDRILEDIENL